MLHFELPRGVAPLPGEVREASLEEELAVIMAQLMMDTVSPKDAVASIEIMCNRRAQLLRDEASQHLHRPARYMHLKALASEMESQAASWHLMWCLFCNDAPAGGLGGPYVKGTGNRKTFRQMVADQVSADPGLRRCANVIGWLESLADDVLSRQPPPRFTDGEGVWMETRIRSAHDPSLTTDLDPDGPSRQQAALHADNARSEERLLARLWQLLRAGRVKEARALCVQCGQPWRAASLGGAGSYGPVPVGIAAGALDEELSPEEQAEDLAVETDSGSGNLRALWKWACMKAAEAAAAQALPAGRYEAAVYAALCGHLQHMLPVCGSSWEDACWAYCRAWLDVAVDEALGLDATLQAQLLAEELVVAAAQLHGDAAAAAGPSGGGDWGSLKQRQALASSLRSCVGEGMGVVQGAWPPRSLQQLANGTQIPRSFAQLFDALASSSSRELAAACREDARQLQQCLIVDDMPRLAGLIRRWLATATTGGNSTSRGAGAGDGDGAMQIEEEEDDDMGGGAAAAAATTAAAGQELGTAPAAGSSDAARTLAFGTHVLLCLASLGSLYRSSGDDAASGGGLHEAQDVAVISGAVQTALASYVSHLIGQLLVEDVPKYVAFLEGDLRTRLFGRFLAAVSAARSDADGLRAYIAASRWFDHCYSRQLQQQQQAPPGGAGNQLTTAVEAEEMRQQVAQYAADCRFSPQLSPSARVRAARWLVYPYLAARAEAPGAVDAVPPLACLDALEHVNALLAELALGDEVTAAAALELLEQVVPPDFDTAAGDSAEMLQRRLPAPGSSAEEALALADALHGLLGQLQAWRGYFSVDKELGVWQAAYSAYAAGRPAGRSAQELREQATSLLRAMLDGMLKGGWLQDAVVPAAAAAAAGDCAMQLVITCRPAAAAAAGPLSSSSSDVVTSWGQQTGSSYPTLSGAELYAAEAALREAVSAAAAAAVAGVPSGVAVEVAGPSGGAASGFLTVSLSCEQGDADAWQRMVRLASAVVQGSLPVKLPEGRSLLLVNLQAPPSCALSLCSLCCLGQLAMRCQGLRVALATHLGADDLLGSDLLELLAGARRVKPLADVLSPAMLQQLLRSEADIAVAALRNAEVAAGITP